MSFSADTTKDYCPIDCAVTEQSDTLNKIVL